MCRYASNMLKIRESPETLLTKWRLFWNIIRLVKLYLYIEQKHGLLIVN